MEAKGKRRFQFSLRTLILSTVILGAAAGWLGKRIQQKRQEREAVAAIVKLRGRVVFDYETYSAKSPGPGWVRSLLGDNFFSDVVEVNFAGVPVGNADLACLDNLLALRKLDLRGTKITDDGLASLAKQQKLETLDISSTRITNAGLLHVGKLRNLRSLSVRYLATTYPRHHPESSNPFDSTLEISAEGLKAPQLLVPPPPWSLPGVVDDSNQQLGIGDAGLEHLSQLNRLESLDLEETDVTSEGISQLSGLSHLTYLCVGGTDVSEAAITDLKHALPQLKVQQGLSAGMRPDALSRSIFFSLAEGANKSIVRALCGEPKTTQASGDSEYWYYRGASYDPETGKPDQSVEVVFKSGIVTGVNFNPR